MAETAGHRAVRSFVRREGRLTHGQQRALTTLWAQYGVDLSPEPLDWESLFGRHAPRIVEIGFGDGESLAAMARAQPDHDFLGIEVHRPGVGHLLLRVAALDLRNLRVLCADAAAIADRQLADASVDRIQIFFPDPWPKKRHHKRRLMTPAFTALLARKLKPGGYLHLATDWEDYALQMLAALDACPDLRNAAGAGFAPRPSCRPLTKFEQRGQRLGHGVWDLLFQRHPA